MPAPAGALASAQGAGSSALPQVYYDPDGRCRVPDSVWTRGDQPEPGRVHIDIWVTGRDFPRAVDKETGAERVFDASVEFDERGAYPLSDPKYDHKKVYGLRVSPQHDGHNELMRWRTANASDQKGLKAALLAACRAGMEAVTMAKMRNPVLRECRGSTAKRSVREWIR